MLSASKVWGYYNKPTMTNFMYRIKEAVAVFFPSSRLPQGGIVLLWLTQHTRKHFANIKLAFFSVINVD